MDSSVRPTMLLSSLVQTRSLELVLAPIASQVSQLIILTETRESTPFPDLMPSAISVMEAVQNLANVAQKIVGESADEQLKADMPVAYNQALAAGQSLLEGAGNLCEDPVSLDAQSLLVSAAQGVLEGTVKVLLVWDDAEVRKIIRTANWVLDRLGAVQGTKSMRGLVICFGGFSESLMRLLELADKRQKELTDAERKQWLLSALDKLKETLPKFSTAMQNFVKNPSSTPAKESADGLAGQISLAIHDLIDAVSPFQEVYAEGEEETDNMAANIMEVHRKLGPTSRYFIGPELDRHIDAVMQNSTAVAHVSRDHYREAILGLCTEIVSLRKELGDHLSAVYANPDSEEARLAFDEAAEQLCEKLCDLDRWVADSVVDQVTDAFMETSAPINHLIQAATASSPPSRSSSSPSPPSTSQLSEDDSLKGLTKHVELFRSHSRRLSQVAAYAAQSSADSKRVQMIKELADEIDKMTPQVVDAALAVRKETSNRSAREHLDTLRREWAGKVQQLTSAIDDIIDPEDFMAVSEANILKDMARCRNAVDRGKWAELAGIVHGIAAKARRVVEVVRGHVEGGREPALRGALTAAVKRLEKAIPKMISLANDLISDPTSQDSHDQFVLSLKELLESIHEIQSVLRGGAPTTQTETPDTTTTTTAKRKVERPKMPATSTPLTSGGVQESTTRRQLDRLSPQTRYIGSLGALQRARAVRILPTPPSKSPAVDEPDRVVSMETPWSYSDGLSRSYGSGDASTQTPQRRTRDQSAQADVRYPSVTFGSPPSPGILSVDSSWSSRRTTPTKHGETPKPKTSPTEKTVRSYASPLQRLVSAAKTGDTTQLPSHASALSARAIRLTGIAESAAGALKQESELVKILQVKASEVTKLTPQVIEKAEEVMRNPQQGKSMDELQTTSHQWAGHVRQLIDATQQANLPWSGTAERLVSAAQKGEGLEKQLHHVSTQTDRMVDVATTTLEAAETEDAIGSTDDSDASQDQELQEQIQRVKVTMSEIQKLTPQLLDAAEMASKQEEGSASMEHLNLLSQEWATKAKVLMRSVDDVTLGMGGPADTLLISARSGDPGLLAEQSSAIQNLASSLQDIAHDAIEGCTDVEKVRVVKVTAKNIEKLSTQLIDCAREVAREQEEEEEGEGEGEGSEAHQLTTENTELLRRNWASQVQLLTAHIDDLTAEVAAPLDRLVEIALQASRTSSIAKERLLSQFKTQASFIGDQMEVVSNLFNEATEGLGESEAEEAVDNVAMAIPFLKKLIPHAIGAARALATDPGSAMLDHFNHLRRQWASKAQFLLANLRKISSIDVEKVLAAFVELIHWSPGGQDARVPRKEKPGSPIHKSYSIEAVSEEKPSEFADLEVKLPSTPDMDLRPRKKMSEPESEMSLRPSHRTKRPMSMAVPLPSWVSGKEGESPNVSSQSIAVAAKSLSDVAEEFHEEGNQLVMLAKTMAQQMFQMAEFTRGRGELQSKEDMILTAKAIAANGQVIVRFANHISEHCTDRRMQANLQYCAEMIPTLSTQLRIIASVKASTPDDASADVMLVKNAQNLMQAVIKTVQAAEAACMRGLKAPEGSEQSEAAALALSWKRKLYRRRAMEAITAPLGARGLRKLNRNRISTPSLVDTIQMPLSGYIAMHKTLTQLTD